MRFRINCVCFTNGGNCLASPGNKKNEYNKCVFQKNDMDKKIRKERHICVLACTCRKRIISHGKESEYFDTKICPQINLKFEKHLARKRKRKKANFNINSPLK